MLHDATLIARLKLRHAKTSVCRSFHLAGTDPSVDRSFALRAYQVYALLIIALALVALWLAALDQIAKLSFGLPSIAGEWLIRSIGAFAALIWGLLSLKALRGRAFSFSDPDIALLLSGPIRLEMVLLIELVPYALKIGIAGALLGFAGGVVCITAGVGIDPFAMSLNCALLSATAPGASWIIGAVRLHRKKVSVGGIRSDCCSVAAKRKSIRIGIAIVSVVVTIAGLVGVAAMPDDAVYRCVSWSTAPLIADVLVAEAALILALGRRVDSAALSQECSLFSDIPKISMLAWGGDPSYSAALQDEIRRRKVASRRPRGKLPEMQGAAVIMAKAALSLRRQREGWMSLSVAALIVAPFGAYAMAAGNANPSLLLLWLLLPQLFARDVRELSQAFREDLRLRSMRDRLPVATVWLFALDVVPFALAALAIQVVAALLSLPFVALASDASFGITLQRLFCLSPLLLAGLAICCSFDAVVLPFGTRIAVQYDWAALAYVGATAIVALCGLSMPLMAIAIVLLDAMLAAAAWRFLC